MIQGKVPFKRMIFVCINQREGEPACANADRGGDSGVELVSLLREELKKRGLIGKMRVAKSGCMDLCGAGPNVMVFDDRGEYSYSSHVSKKDIPEIVERYLTVTETSPA